MVNEEKGGKLLPFQRAQSVCSSLLLSTWAEHCWLGLLSSVSSPLCRQHHQFAPQMPSPAPWAAPGHFQTSQFMPVSPQTSEEEEEEAVVAALRSLFAFPSAGSLQLTAHSYFPQALLTRRGHASHTSIRDQATQQLAGRALILYIPHCLASSLSSKCLFTD